MIIIARAFIIQALALLLFALLWWLLTPANAHAVGKTAVESISYPTVAAVVSATLLLAKTVEQLLNKAGLLRSEQEKQIIKIYDWMLDSRNCGARMIEELHSWHKPIETPSGTKFTWRDSGEHAALERATAARIEETILAVGKQVLQIAHNQDLIMERMEQEDR
jgi:hypothetical protein